MTDSTQHLTAALNLAQLSLPRSGPIAPHAARLRESLDLASAATDPAAKVGHLKDARAAVDLALDLLTEEASRQATPTAPDVRP